jgi:hypothetical protein
LDVVDGEFDSVLVGVDDSLEMVELLVVEATQQQKSSSTHAISSNAVI